jgi:hypothetical protein
MPPNAPADTVQAANTDEVPGPSSKPVPKPDPNDPLTQLASLVVLLSAAGASSLEAPAIHAIANLNDHPVYGPLVRPLVPLALKAMLVWHQSASAYIERLEGKLASSRPSFSHRTDTTENFSVEPINQTNRYGTENLADFHLRYRMVSGRDPSLDALNGDGIRPEAVVLVGEAAQHLGENQVPLAA